MKGTNLCIDLKAIVNIILKLISSTCRHWHVDGIGLLNICNNEIKFNIKFINITI